MPIPDSMTVRTEGGMAPLSHAPVPESTTSDLKLQITGMTCAACQARIQRKLKAEPGVQDASVNLVTGQALVRFEPGRTAPGRLIGVVEDLGYGARLPSPKADVLAEESALEAEQGREYQVLRARALLSLAFALLAMLVSMPLMATHAGHGLTVVPFMRWMMGSLNPVLETSLPWLYSMDKDLLTYLLLAMTAWVMAVPGRPFYVRAYRAARHGSADMNTLVALGTGAAFAYSLAASLAPGFFLSRGVSPDVYYEAVLFIIALILFGNTLEARARRRTAEALRALAGLQPKVARVVRHHVTVEIPIDEVSPGDVVQVRPGEKLPVDGVILEGRSGIDESMLTGESMPFTKGPGDKVIGGSINRNGALRYEATDLGDRSVLSRIIHLMREAQGSRAPIQRLTDRISGLFVPMVVLLSVLTFLGWLLFAGTGALVQAFAAAVAVLIIACPCAMGLAVPTAILVASGRGAAMGILIKGGEALQRASEVDTVVLDKTGTVTEGRPVVVDIQLGEDGSEAALLRLSAAVEAHSEHPLASAIVARSREMGLASPEAESFQAFPGMGAMAVVEGKAVVLGNRRMMGEFAIGTEPFAREARRLAEQAASLVYVAVDGRPAGLIAIADPIRSSSKAAIDKLKSMGLRVVLLSGDQKSTAQAVARRVGIEEVVAEVTPEGKVEEIARLQALGAKVAMVGDGINDAPALSKADIGIAMGSGTDIAMEAGDATLMRGDLSGIVPLISLSRKTLTVIRQNLFWAFAFNSVGIPLAAGVLFPSFGILLSPVLASAAMALSSVSVVSNSLRLRTLRIERV